MGILSSKMGMTELGWCWMKQSEVEVHVPWMIGLGH